MKIGNNRSRHSCLAAVRQLVPKKEQDGCNRADRSDSAPAQGGHTPNEATSTVGRLMCACTLTRKISLPIQIFKSHKDFLFWVLILLKVFNTTKFDR